MVCGLCSQLVFGAIAIYALLRMGKLRSVEVRAKANAFSLFFKATGGSDPSESAPGYGQDDL